MPDGRLMLLMGGTGQQQRQPRVSFSTTVRSWTRPSRILEPGDWLWRLTWHGSRGYGVSYRLRTRDRWETFLFDTADGLAYRRICRLDVSGKPNEATLRFTHRGDAVALVRREAGDASAWIGTSRPPYENWRWHPAGRRAGGPNFLMLPDLRMIGGFRDYRDDGPVTVLARMTSRSLRPVLTLPSGGDCSYPGLVWHRGQLWVSYYSSHERKTSIYLAKVRL